VSLGHLVRRAVTSFSNREPGHDAAQVAVECLLPAELELWSAMQSRDRRHSLEVLARFDRLAPHSSRAERAAALLHDVGKTESGLGWMLRIVATLVGPRGRRFRDYHDHESIGAAMLRGISDGRTVELVAGLADDDVAGALSVADEI